MQTKMIIAFQNYSGFIKIVILWSSMCQQDVFYGYHLVIRVGAETNMKSQNWICMTWIKPWYNEIAPHCPANKIS